jgi:type II secretory pathway component PulJ
MSLYDPDRRYRRRTWGAITRFGFYVVTLGVASAFAYQTGVQQVENREERLEDRVAELESALATAEQNAIRMEAAANTATIQYDELLARFEREVPGRQERRILALVAERLEAGVDLERIAFFIDEAAPPAECTEADRKRFILPTAVYDGPNTSIAFADGKITVTGRGTNATSEGGGTLGWYDPAQDVRLDFTVIGGSGESVEGVLPLHHSVVLDGAEWRFTAVPGERSIVNVVADRCTFPEAPPLAQGSADPQ